MLMGRYRGAHRTKESRAFYQDLPSPLTMEAESEEKPQQVVCLRTQDEAGGLDLDERTGSEYLKLASLLHWQTWLEMPAGVWIIR